MNNKILQESADDSILQEDLDRISAEGQDSSGNVSEWADWFSAGKSITVL